MPTNRPLPLDPIAEAHRQWEQRWDAADVMAAATSIMRAQQIVQARVEEALRAFDLTFARYEALVLLGFSRRGALPMGKMGERLMIHPTSVTNIVDRLEVQGFVRRRPHETDRRTTLVEITDTGRQVMERATKEVITSSFGLDVLSSREVDQLTRLLRKVRIAVGDFTP
ncbi:MAG TPA: MarR family transcriptional regulator [Acidimicrobiales bacterium]|nr:MarR family transcriptional regulator [Acidimicrobiales bacterium]